VIENRETPSIDRDELWDKILRGDRFFLFEVLGEMYYRRHHLPGALHLPPDRVLETVTALVPDRDAEIVLYCWDDD
jgi:rhodanese-related sulfurtransferase